jgi:SAM-dependent methyltransferase
MSDDARPDFEAAYQGEPPPWEIGAPQPEVVKLADGGGFRGSVLDVGCGTGENALFLAARGHPVLGVDGAPTAIERARDKARARGVDVRFVLGEALDLGALRERFETALDCGLFHALRDEERVRYAESLASALGSGGQVYLLCFSDEEPPGWGPRRISERELRSTFRRHFAISSISPARFATRLPREDPRAWLATLVRL